tara:strand:- start:742 stop:1278 length:537 start_codon:yes stop_codon:yes gene_type:complete
MGEYMFNKIKKLPWGWLIVISLLVYSVHTDYMNDVKYVEHRKEVQLFMNEVNSNFRDVEKQVWITSNKIVKDYVDEVTKNNDEYLTKVDKVLKSHESRRKELMSLLHNKIDFYGDKIDYFENSLDSTLESYTLALDVSVSMKDELLRHEISLLNDKLSEVDSMMYKLQNNWLTKGAFK